VIGACACCRRVVVWALYRGRGAPRCTPLDRGSSERDPLQLLIRGEMGTVQWLVARGYRVHRCSLMEYAQELGARVTANARAHGGVSA
jgi:hypothetical protein